MNMMTSFHTAAVGMMGQQEGLDVTANNLANLSTDGYKTDRAAFSDLLYTNMKQETGASYLKAGSGSKLWKTDTSLDKAASVRPGEISTMLCPTAAIFLPCRQRKESVIRGTAIFRKHWAATAFITWLIRKAIMCWTKMAETLR